MEQINTLTYNITNTGYIVMNHHLTKPVWVLMLKDAIGLTEKANEIINVRTGLSLDKKEHHKNLIHSSHIKEGFVLLNSRDTIFAWSENSPVLERMGIIENQKLGNYVLKLF